MNKELLAELKHEKEVYREWKEEWITCEEYKNTVQASKS